MSEDARRASGAALGVIYRGSVFAKYALVMCTIKKARAGSKAQVDSTHLHGLEPLDGHGRDGDLPDGGDRQEL